jgi:HlyD family secretion protein
MKKKNNILKYLLIAAAILILFVIVGKSLGWIGGAASIKVSVEEAAERTITETVAASGKIYPEREVKISADVSGEVVELNVKEGQRVQKGDLLVRINPDIYMSALDRMNATLNNSRATLANMGARLTQAQAQFEKAEAAFNRNKRLYDQGTISASEYENIKSTYDVAKADVEAARQSVIGAEYNVKSTEAAVKEARENLAKTSIMAPVDGTISKLNIEQGERVVGTLQMAGTEMMIIANLGEMQVEVDVSENDIVRVKQGDTTLVEVDAYPDKKFTGLVTEIANTAAATLPGSEQVTNFKVKIRILRNSYEDMLPEGEEHKSPFKPGMSATVEIQTNRVSNVVSVPIQAVTAKDTAQKIIRDSPDSGAQIEAGDAKDNVKEYVFIERDGKAILTGVKTGIQDRTYIQILDGVTAGDRIIVAPYSAISRNLKHEDPVEVVAKDKLFTKGK